MPTALIADDEDLLRAELRRMLAAAWPELVVVVGRCFKVGRLVA